MLNNTVIREVMKGMERWMLILLTNSCHFFFFFLQFGGLISLSFSLFCSHTLCGKVLVKDDGYANISETTISVNIGDRSYLVAHKEFAPLQDGSQNFWHLVIAQVCFLKKSSI